MPLCQLVGHTLHVCIPVYVLYVCTLVLYLAPLERALHVCTSEVQDASAMHP